MSNEVDLMNMDDAASDHKPNETWKGHGKSGRPRSPVKRKQKLFRISKPAIKRIQKSLSEIEKSQGQKFTESMVVEIASLLLKGKDLDEIIRLVAIAERGE